MMKKYLLYIFLFTAALSSCKKNTTEPIIGDVDERLSSTLTAYQTQLTGAQFGWKAYLLTDSKETATFLFNFTDKNRITMSADYLTTSAESSYRLKALQRPTLLFDTYSTLHLFADPTPSKFQGATGVGHYSDFEFVFLSASTDTIKLEGTFNKSKMILVRSKSVADNASAFTAPQTMSGTLSKLRTYFKRTTVGTVECEVNLDPFNRIFAFNYKDGATLKTSKSNYFVSGSSLVFFDPIVIGSTTVTGLSDVSFDSGTGFISAKTNSGVGLQIKEAISPLLYDKTVAARFLANPVYGTYSECYTGFTVDGVVDAYGVRSIPNFVDVDFIPKYSGAFSALNVYTAAGYLNFTPGFTTTVNSEGILTNVLGGYFTSTAAQPNNTVKNIIINTANNFGKVGGFYVIQTDTKVFDLVAVADARSWITYE